MKEIKEYLKKALEIESTEADKDKEYTYPGTPLKKGVTDVCLLRFYRGLWRVNDNEKRKSESVKALVEVSNVVSQ